MIRYDHSPSDLNFWCAVDREQKQGNSNFLSALEHRTKSYDNTGKEEYGYILENRIYRASFRAFRDGLVIHTLGFRTLDRTALPFGYTENTWKERKPLVHQAFADYFQLPIYQRSYVPDFYKSFSKIYYPRFSLD